MKLFQKLKSLIFKPDPNPVWTGTCDCCKKELKSYDRVFLSNEKVECLGCLCGTTEAGRKRKEDRRQIDLYKQAIKELEEEKQPQSNQEARNEYAQKIRRHLKN